ncbi:MAG: rhodanese-like domain-containing protein [Myxococcaceae bacterium]
MRFISVSLSLLFATPVLAEHHEGEKAKIDGHDEFKKLTVKEASAMKAAGTATMVDANGAETRAKYGYVPGAVLLSDASSFDVVKELPAAKDRTLVFYCGGPKCEAAPSAAKRAKEAGYTNLAVMREGIRGWVSAGQAVEKPGDKPKG